jgi:hypothetical protein
MDMHVADFESLSMRREAGGHLESEALLMANFINNISNVNVLHIVPYALCATEGLIWIKVYTQVLHEARV